MSAPEREATLRTIASTDAERAALAYSWEFWGRPNQQMPPGAWRFWLLLAGRGFGKTRTAGEWIRKRVEDEGAKHLILAGATAQDLRDIMIEGESGILAISPSWSRPKYEPSKSRLTWKNGARALLLSADEPERFRGKQSDTIWADELASWRYPEAWDQLMFGFRLGSNYGVKPRGVISTTPRPTPTIRDLVKGEMTVVTRGSTYDNRSNLSPEFFGDIVKKYEGTRLGRQELHAEILDDAEGALWSRDMIDAGRVHDAPRMRRVVVAIDPAVSNNAGSDETGIVVVGLGEDGRGYVLADLSGRYSPNEWGQRALKAYHEFRADRIIAEVNNGGALVEANLRTINRNVSYKAVHAAQGKRTRAEPIAALYEQGRVSHVGMFAKLEDQLCTWEALSGEKSPDRLDAMVWGLSELMMGLVVHRNFTALPPG